MVQHIRTTVARSSLWQLPQNVAPNLQHRLLLSLQPLNPSPCKRRCTPTATNSTSKPSKKPNSTHLLTQTAQFCNPMLPNSSSNSILLSEHLPTTSYNPTQPRTTPTTNIDPQIIDSDNYLALPQLLVVNLSSIPPSYPPVPGPKHHIPSLATPSVVIHAQTVVVNNHPSPSSPISDNGSTVF
jgi:hypothetical protein